MQRHHPWQQWNYPNTTDKANSMINCMMDLETWGTRPGCAIRSIGAVMFDPKNDKLGSTFYETVLDASCKEAGLHTDPGTAKWWSEQSQEARDALVAGTQLTLIEVAEKFDAWWKQNRAIYVWSQGGNFDEPIWSVAMHSVGRKVPWRYYDTRCTRTIYSLARLNPKTIKREGTHHNALEDAKYQAKCVQASYARLNNDK